MTPAEIGSFKVELLDDIHELPSEPVADAEAVRQRVEALFTKLEEEIGEKTRTTAG
jgi:hypothetical protein